MLFISKHDASAVHSVTSGVQAKLFAPFLTSTIQVLFYSKAWNNRFLCSAWKKGWRETHKSNFFFSVETWVQFLPLVEISTIYIVNPSHFVDFVISNCKARLRGRRRWSPASFCEVV